MVRTFSRLTEARHRPWHVPSHELTGLAARGVLTISEIRPYPLDRAGAAMAQVRHGAHGAAIVLTTAQQLAGRLEAS